MKKIDGKHAVKIGLSILIAVCIWLYVGIVDPTEVSAWARNVPVEFVGETTLANRGLMVTESSTDTVNLRLNASRNVISALDTKQIRVLVDLSNITQTGTYNLSYTEDYPSNISASRVSVESASVYTITVTVGELYKKSVDVQYEITGEVPEGYLLQPLVEPVETLDIHGRQADVIKVSYAKVSFDVTDKTASVNEMLSFQYYDSGNQLIESEGIYSNTTQLPLNLPIYQEKDVKLTTTLQEAEGLRSGSVIVTVQPSHLKLAGEYYLMEGLEEFSVATIDLAKVTGSMNRTYPLELPEGMISVDGATEVTVSITLKSIETRSFTAERFSTENVPEGLSAEVTNSSINISLRGPTDQLETATAEQILVIADLSGITAAGSYSVPAVIRYEGSEDLGVAGSYQVNVEVSDNGE